ncbi:MAG: hypothetical protein GXP23_07655 [Gammaproteobacteria bacterium]|nr:hypothetical protein [Gammaproteobacteria bacterium]
MIEIGLLATMVFLLVAIITSYLLRDVIAKTDGIGKESIEKTQLIAIGMKPITSVKACFILPWKKLPGSENLNVAGKLYLLVTKIAVSLAVLSILLGVIFEIW